MKIWYGFGSEHSANLVLIGRFKDAGTAHSAKEAIDLLSQQQASEDNAQTEPGSDNSDRFSDQMLQLLRRVGVYMCRPAELEQLNFEFSAELKGTEIRITTDETEISAFLKILLAKGARIEVYSADDYPEAPKQ